MLAVFVEDFRAEESSTPSAPSLLHSQASSEVPVSPTLPLQLTSPPSMTAGDSKPSRRHFGKKSIAGAVISTDVIKGPFLLRTTRVVSLRSPGEVSV